MRSHSHRAREYAGVRGKRMWLWVAVVAAAMAGDRPAVAMADESSHGGFRDVTEQAGLTHIQRREVDEGNPYLTGGGAVGDFFGNGYPDLYFTRHDDTDILYKNLGDGTFEDRTDQVFGDEMVSAPTNGAMFADLNNNGHLDLVVTTNGGMHHLLYINDGYGGLTEQAFERGLAQQVAPGVVANVGQSVTAGDFTGDQLLDLFISDWRPRASSGPGNLPRNRLYRNNRAGEPGHFEDVTWEAGLDRTTNQWGFTGRFADINRDGRMDLLVVNDWGQGEYYRNNGDGTFIEAATEMGTGTGTNEMGSTVADYNNNGYLDWFVTSISGMADPDTDGNRLYRNEVHRGWDGVYFTDQTDAGVRDGRWGWGTSFIDHDNNGLRDLVMVNGYYMRNYQGDAMKLWRNNGPANGYSFTEVGSELGLTDSGQGRGLIVADFFGNGQLDILVINHAARPVLYRNQGQPEHNWLRIDTVGEASNAMGIGAFITVKPDLETDHLLVHDVNLGANYLAHNETTAHFGLGRHEGPVDYVRIEWPSGMVQEFRDIAPNQRLTVHETEGIISGPGAAGSVAVEGPPGGGR